MQADKSNFQAYSKVRGLLTSASEELPDVPLYYNLHTMCKTLRVTPPGNSIVRSAIVNAGECPCRRLSSYTYCVEAFVCHKNCRVMTSAWQGPSCKSFVVFRKRFLCSVGDQASLPSLHQYAMGLVASVRKMYLC